MAPWHFHFKLICVRGVQLFSFSQRSGSSSKSPRCAQHQRKHLHAFANKTLIEINISAKCGSALNPVYNYSRHQRPRVNKQSNYQSARAVPSTMQRSSSHSQAHSSPHMHVNKPNCFDARAPTTS